MRRTLVPMAVVGLALAAASPASAATSANANSCKFNLDNVWRQGSIELAGVAGPNPAPPNAGVSVTQSSARLRLPDYIAEAGYNLQIFKAGDNEIKARVWLAVEGQGTTQRVVVHQFDTVARLTITDDGNGTFVSSTPIDASVALPDTTWTTGTTPVAFRQAGPETLPPVPAGVANANVQPLGSALIRADVGGFRVLLDCQPATGEGAVAPKGFVANPFENVTIQAGAPATVPAPKAKPAVALRTTKLKAKGRKLKVALSCTAADCKGALTLKAGSKSLVRSTKYSVKSGARKTVTLTLTKTAQRSLKHKKKLKVTVRVTATGGKTITKKLTLR